jgi:hypothetical protein
MEVIARVFEQYDRAVQGVQALRNIGIPENRLALLAAGHAVSGKATTVPVSDTESPGMGAAMGAAVGGAIGAAGGATLGLAAATLLIPGVGPVVAFGLIGAAVLGASGAAVGAAAGGTLEEGLGEGFPHEDIYLFEDALRHGRSVVVAYADEGDQADKTREILANAGAVDLEALREQWWAELRDNEFTHYQSEGRDFQKDELSYQRGFAAALHPERRGKTYAQCEAGLQEVYKEDCSNPAFRSGYDRGATYQSTLTEKHKV